MTTLLAGSVGLAFGAVAVFGGVALAVVSFAPQRPRVALARHRPPRVADAPSIDAATAPVRLVERLFNRRGRIAVHATSLELAGVKRRLGAYVVTVAGVGIAAAVIATLLLGPLAGPLALVATGGVATVSRRVRTRRRQAAFADQLDDSLSLLASSLRAGHSLLRALDAVSREAETPTSQEFARVVNQSRVGRDLDRALEETAERMACDDFVWIAHAIATHREVGGNLAEVLDTVAETIRERNQIRRQVKVLSAEGRLSAIVLMVLPFAVMGVLLVINPGYIAKFTSTPIGYALLGFAALLLLVGGAWLRKVVQFRF